MGIEAITQKSPVHASTANKKAAASHTAKATHISFPAGVKTHETQKKQTKDEIIQKHIIKDLASGALTKEDGVSFAGVKLTKDRMVFHQSEFKKTNGKRLTFGEISERYDLKPGVLKKENSLRFLPYDMDSRGDDLNAYYPEEICSPNVDIPADAMKKHLDAISK